MPAVVGGDRLETDLLSSCYAQDQPGPENAAMIQAYRVSALTGLVVQPQGNANDGLALN